MSFFLSSPPQPTYQRSYQLPHGQHSSFTPQTHRTTFFPESTGRPYPQFLPNSPSPLRPSWNSGNVMRRQAHTLKADYDQTVWQGEIPQQENTTEKDTSFTIQPDTLHHTSNTDQSILTTTNSSIDTSSSSLPSQPQQRNPFTYQAPAQSLHPTTLLSTRLRHNRSARRTLFLDRLRTSRRDERDNHIIERFEKEEYWRERRRREERMAREAYTEIEWEEEGLEDWDEGEGEREMTPIDEEDEVGELVEGWLGRDLGREEQQVQQQHGVQDGAVGGPEVDTMDAQYDFEDSDVDEVFMQVLSQQEGEGRQDQNQNQSQAQQLQLQLQIPLSITIPSNEGNESLPLLQAGQRGEGDGYENQEMIASQKDTEML